MKKFIFKFHPQNKTWSATTLEVDDRDEEDYVRVNSFIDHHAAETSVSKATECALHQVDDSDADVIEVEDVVVDSSASPPSVIPPPPRSRSGTPELECLDVAASPSPVCTPTSPPEENEDENELDKIVDVSFDGDTATFRVRYKHLLHRHHTKDDWYLAKNVPFDLRFDWLHEEGNADTLTAAQRAACEVEEEKD